MPKPTILIADDEEGIRESLNLILGDDYDLTYAVDGEETIAKAQRQRFGAILLDIKMPKLDGLEVLKRLRQTDTKVPILMLTAYQSVELAKEAVRLGADNYLPKPFEREQILSAVRKALG
jgi:DNA-binding response OmpR family regulator